MSGQRLNRNQREFQVSWLGGISEQAVAPRNNFLHHQTLLQEDQKVFNKEKPSLLVSVWFWVMETFKLKANRKLGNLCLVMGRTIISFISYSQSLFLYSNTFSLLVSL